ncbi:MAG: ATP-binding protein [Bryobacteraceae bacterium]|nr:ATP-binding protein [Bryobacteraceae bacterium]
MKRKPQSEPKQSGWSMFRALRFRLAVTYVIFFALVLSVVGLLFRETLATTLSSHTRALLEEDFVAVKGYLRIERRQPIWFYDKDDPEEAFFVERLKDVFLLADKDGKVLEVTNGFLALGVEPPDRIQQMVASQKPYWAIRENARGDKYLVRGGGIDEKRAQYFMAIGRPLSENEAIVGEFTLKYVAVMPLLLVTAAILGWFFAGRALRPVNDLAERAGRISETTLAMRIPKRGSNDELDHLIDTFNSMMARLETSFLQSRQFNADVSHELRTPLTCIRGQLEVALLTAKSEEQYREAIQEALEDVERLGQIVKSLLLLSQAESGHLTLQRMTLDLAALAADVVEQFQIPADAASVRLLTRLPENCPAEADRVQLERLLSNLLSNAIKYTPAGGAITVALDILDGEARLTVEDTGVGIPEEHLGQIFNRFYRVPGQVDSAGERGLGLGLSFVAWIAKAHGGSVEVTSTPGKGTRFTVRLPVLLVTPAAPEPREAPAHHMT